MSLSTGLITNYSKSFGLTFINNDHFFATVAIFQNILNGCSRIFWGLLYDRFGVRKCLIAIGLITTVLTASLPLLPYLGQESPGAKVGYSLVMIGLYGTFPGVYAVVAPAVADCFGRIHFKANFGLLFTTSLAYSAVILIVTQVVRSEQVLIFSSSLPLGSRHLRCSGIHRYFPSRWGLWSYRGHQQSLPSLTVKLSWLERQKKFAK